MAENAKAMEEMEKQWADRLADAEKENKVNRSRSYYWPYRLLLCWLFTSNTFLVPATYYDAALPKDSIPFKFCLLEIPTIAYNLYHTEKAKLS